MKLSLKNEKDENSKCQKSLQETKNELKNICTSSDFPAWSEWSNCSKTCYGIKTRMDKCQNDQKQIKPCNQDPSICPRSGKFSLRVS